MSAARAGMFAPDEKTLAILAGIPSRRERPQVVTIMEAPDAGGPEQAGNAAPGAGHHCTTRSTLANPAVRTQVRSFYDDIEPYAALGQSSQAGDTSRTFSATNAT